jgi:histone-lysine N-methyltransferase SETD2
MRYLRHDAQVCYCGEAKCVGFIGGKTQTDLAAMDDLYLDGMYLYDLSFFLIVISL